MAVHWQTTFKSFDETTFIVKIYDNTYSGDVVDLNGSDSPFETSENSDVDIFSPVRTQTGYLKLVTDSIAGIKDVIPVELMDRPVELVDGNGTVKWAGYIQDNVFSSPWDRGPLTAEMPVFSSLEVMKSIPFQSSLKYMSLSEILCVIFRTFRLYDSIYIPIIDIDLLTLRFNSVMFHGDGEETETVYPGENDNSIPPTQKPTCYDVIKEICTYFGFTARDFGSSLWFVSIGATQYKKYTITRTAFEASISSYFSLYNPNDIDVELGSKNHTYNYVPGVSYIDIAEHVRTDFKLVHTDLKDGETFGSLMRNWDYMYVNYDSGSGKAVCTQYYVSGGGATSSFIDLLSRTYNDPTYYGGQLVFMSKENYLEALASDKEQFGFKPVLAVKYGGMNIAATFRSGREISGRSFPGGLALMGNLMKYDVVDGFVADTNGVIQFSLKWGDKYYNPSTRAWQTASVIINSSAGDVIHGGRIDWTGGFQISPKDLYYINVDSSLNGEIVLNIYGYGNSSSYTGIELIDNLEIKPFAPFDGVVDLNVDNSENHYRQQLNYAKDDIYERDSKFSSHLNDGQYGESFVLNGDNTYYTGNHESDLLQILTEWKDHTSEQIKVDTLFERADGDAFPCDLITLNGSNYNIVFQSTKWRDSIKTYTLQKKS